MFRQLIFATACIILAGDFVQASEVSEWLWGGRGSRTTVSNVYVPPPLMTEATVVPIETAGVATTQSNLMLGTPGAMTLPPGGVLATNGVAATGFSSSGYVVPTQFTTASNSVPLSQIVPQQPVIDYEWTYSTIKDVSYDPVTAYDPRVGGYVTTWQEKRTESVLPWLHRKQVVRYPSVPQQPAASQLNSSALIGNPNASVVSDTSERRIVNRLFPVSTVPSPPAQAVPVQQHIPIQVYPVQNAPIATESADFRLQTPDYRVEYQPPTPNYEVRSQNGVIVDDLPVVPAVTIPYPVAETAPPVAPGTFNLTQQEYSATISSQRADEPPTLPSIVSPSAHQVLYPTPLSNAQSDGLQASDFRLRGSDSPPPSDIRNPKPATNQPTLAPLQSEAVPTMQETVRMQRELIEDSLSASERPTAVELPSGATLPPPAQSSVIPSLELPARTEMPSANTTDSGIPFLQSPGGASPSTVPSTTQPASPTSSGSRPGMNQSPTRMWPMYH